jgi:ribosomal protein S18 acetylase RimI-like enzyme
LEIRSYKSADEALVAAIWHRAGLDEYSYLPRFLALTSDAARKVFAEVIVPDAQLQVAWDSDQAIGFIALKGSYIDRLYVDPGAQRRGCGVRLLAWAREQSPAGLELHTHQQNTRARAFYEKHGFQVFAFGVSSAPELVPDVEYHWRPVMSESGA